MLKVLVVDDDQGLRLSVKTALAVTQRFEIDEAFDGVNAMEKIKAGDKKYDVVILDVDMPRMNGLQTLRAIKEFDAGIIVMVMTAHATLNDAVTAVKDGAYNFLSKPGASEELLALIDKAVT